MKLDYTSMLARHTLPILSNCFKSPTVQKLPIQIALRIFQTGVTVVPFPLEYRTQSWPRVEANVKSGVVPGKNISFARFKNNIVIAIGSPCYNQGGSVERKSE